jgi:hypothetical protein
VSDEIFVRKSADITSCGIMRQSKANLTDEGALPRKIPLSTT